MIKHIRYNNVSTEDLGITVHSGYFGKPAPRIITSSVPYRDGEIDFSRLDGDLHYDNRISEFTFNIVGLDAEDAALRLSKTYKWLYSIGSGELLDEHDYLWRLEKTRCISTSDPEYLDIHRRMIRITAQFSSAPYMVTASRNTHITDLQLTADKNDYLFRMTNNRANIHCFDATTFSNVTVDSKTATVTVPAYANETTYYKISKANGLVTNVRGINVIFASTDDYFYAAALSTGTTKTLTLDLSRNASVSTITALSAGYGKDIISGNLTDKHTYKFTSDKFFTVKKDKEWIVPDEIVSLPEGNYDITINGTLDQTVAFIATERERRL